MSSVYRASYLLTLLSGCGSLLFVTIALAQDQDVLELANYDPLAQREQLQQQLTEVESTLGRHDPALIEILSSLAGASAPLGLYSEASNLLARSLQIQRFNLGLFTAEQIPLIIAKMHIDARAGEWETVNESIDYLHWLLVVKNVSEGEALIDNLIRLSEFHLRGVVSDAVNLQAHHYQQASKITYEALRISEESLGIHDPRVVDLHYSLVKQFYLQSAAVERGNETAYALRAMVPGSKWVRPRRIARSRYYNAGLRLLNDIRKIVAQREQDTAESLAMVDLYTADWHLLFDESQAEVAYKNAFVRLREADVDTAELDLLFATPNILPIPNFHGTVTNALTTNYSAQSSQPDEHGNERNSDLSLQEWFDNMSVVSFPVSAPAQPFANSKQQTKVRLRFSLDSLNNTSHWVGGRYRTNRSVAEEFYVLDSDAPPGFDIESLDEYLQLLHFRPRLEDGIARPYEGTLLYPVTVN